LLTYDEVGPRAELVADVTGRRIMPPWLPERRNLAFADQRGLTQEQIDTIATWVSQGALEGEAADLPSRPAAKGGWPLGEPDVVLEITEPYTLPAGGDDVFRNFVIPVPGTGERYVRAIDLRPGNPRFVHHAVVVVDANQESRARDAQDREPGFEGMDLGGDISSPDGHFIGWTPGKVPYMGPESIAWRLPAGADLVLMLHLMPGDTPQEITSQLALYFSTNPPSQEPVMLRLGSKAMDIQPDASNYQIDDELLLPVDVEVLSIYPHAHYLGKTITATATLPDGSTQTLLHIPSWDFQWQDEYRYARPLHLPRGTAVRMRFTYDNSGTNPHNRHRPPQRVLWGPQSTDEMGYLWVQTVPSQPQDVDALKRAANLKKLLIELDGFRHALALNPRDSQAHNNLGAALNMLRRPQEAEEHFAQAIANDSAYAAPQFNLGVLRLDRGDLAGAQRLFERTLELDPRHTGAMINLGALFADRNDLPAAQRYFERALAIREDPDAHFNLGVILRRRGQSLEARKHFEAVLRLDPDRSDVRIQLQSLRTP
jgi:Tfp pilus assembly protein PilF